MKRRQPTAGSTEDRLLGVGLKRHGQIAQLTQYRQKCWLRGREEEVVEIDDKRWEWLAQLDGEMLQGGVMMSDFATELIRNADLCFASGAFVACLVMSGATVETWLREEGTPGSRFIDLINGSNFDEATKTALHDLRHERNRWVHIDDPWEENDLEEQYSTGHPDLESRCKNALRLMRSVVYSTPWV